MRWYIGRVLTPAQSIDTLSLADQTAVNTVWSLFSSSSHAQRALILRGLLTMCCSSQLSLLSSELAMAIRIDPFTLFPKEVSLRVLGYLDAISLGRAAQVSRLWRQLADNDLLWRNMCEQHIERKCEKCGWGLPLLNDGGRRAKGAVVHAGGEPSAFSHDSELREASAAGGDGSLRRSVTAAANAAAIERRSRAEHHHHDGDECAAASPAPGPRGTKRSRPLEKSDVSRCVTRPWKEVYCERLVIERNWRRGRHSARVLTGHTDGIMCLGFKDHVPRSPCPILITGSYDRTARIWNLETGEQLRTLSGHARGVRCLQFDDVKLITGSMDRTLKIWNWRTGELMRTLEGHTEGIVSLNFNESILASGSADSNIRIWNFRTAECFELRGHSDWVNAVQLWSPPHPRGGSGHSGSLDSMPPMFLFSASDDGTIRLWDLQHRDCIMTYRGHVGQVQSLKVMQMDNAAVRKLSRGAMQVDQPESADSDSEEAPNGSAPPGSGSCAPAPGSSPGGHVPNAAAPAIPEHLYLQAARLPRGGNARAANTRRMPPMVMLTQARLSAADLAPELPANATIGDIEDGIFAHDEPEDDSELPGAQQHERAQWRSKKRTVLLSGSLDNTLKLWDVRTGRCLRTLFGHVEGVWSVDADTLRIASASHDRTVKVWDRDTGQCQNTLVGHRAAVTCVALGDDKIVSGGDDGAVRVWRFAPDVLIPTKVEGSAAGAQ